MQHCFKQTWERFHAEQIPLGYQLREAGAQHWLRFHSLPESKRYPETRDEMATVIRRANSTAYATLGRGESWLVKVTFDWKASLPQTESVIESWTTEAAKWARRQKHRERHALQRYGLVQTELTFLLEEDEDTVGLVHATRVRWGDKRFASLIRAIAEDRTEGWLWMSNDTGAIFAPYDGGADLFLPSNEQVAEMRARWPGWLSTSPSGL